MRRVAFAAMAAVGLAFLLAAPVRAAIAPAWAAFACGAGGDPGAPFLDVDGDGCFGPGDVALDPAVLGVSFDAAVDAGQPTAGLVVPPSVRRLEVAGDATWTVGGDVLLHGTKLVIPDAATLAVEAGGRTVLDGVVVRGGGDTSLLLYPGGDVSLDGTIRLKACRSCVEAEGFFAVIASSGAPYTTFLEDGTGISAGNVQFDTSIVAGDVKVEAVGFSNLGQTVGTVVAGRVRLSARYATGIEADVVTIDDLKVTADHPEVGAITLGGGDLSIGRLVAKATRTIQVVAIADIGPENDQPGQKSVLVAEEISLFGSYDLERVELTGTTIDLFSGGPLELRNSVVTGRDAGAGIALVASSCDLTGTRFRRIAVADGCGP